MFKNMKIEINEHQPLDEVIEELERLGYRHLGISCIYKGNSIICTNDKGYYVCLKRPTNFLKKTTLVELKQMK